MLTSVEVRAFARLDTQVMIEVATRNTLRAEPRLPKLVYNTGDSIPFQVALRLAGLPIVANANTSIKVTGSLVQPAGALGTVLGNAKVTKGALDAALGANKDLTPAAAKLGLLGRDQLPGYRSPPALELRDDGKSGDGAAGDGVFGVLVPANLPGLYQLTAQAAMSALMSAAFLAQRSLERSRADSGSKAGPSGPVSATSPCKGPARSGCVPWYRTAWTSSCRR